ncbi:MAG: helix-turn-helix transcriptional regulator [Lachnospiraceae bacterium]|nr:helix-turn-helix transcriptional regulator [Lachnospiraceae bacterium]
MLGKTIKDYLRENGIKQTYLSEETGINQQTLNDMLNGRRRIEATEYMLICRALKVSTNFFAEKLGILSVAV